MPWLALLSVLASPCLWVSRYGWQIVLWALRLGLASLAVVVYVHAVRRTRQIKRLADLAARQAELILQVTEHLQTLEARLMEAEHQAALGARAGEPSDTPSSECGET